MGRKKMLLEEKKIKITLCIDPKIDLELEDLKINKSKLINWLLAEHLNNFIVVK